MTSVAVRRWERQIATPYEELTEAEKNSDREWADKVLDVLRKDLERGWIAKAKSEIEEWKKAGSPLIVRTIEEAEDAPAVDGTLQLALPFGRPL